MNAVPRRELELAAFLSRMHHTTRHHLGASECETMSLASLLAMADAEDLDRWQRLTLAYTDPVGASWLRETIAAMYQGVTAADLVCFAGAQEALYATMHALLTPGDHAVVVVPGYQSIETLAMALGPVTGVGLDPRAAWALDLGAVAAAIRPTTRLIAISFPNNPTGALLSPDQFASLIALCRDRGIWLLSDEVYRLTERDPAERLPPAVDAYERGISIGVLSKAFGLPGLRIGWVACREQALLQRVAAFRQYLSVCGAGPSEVLAQIALKNAGTILGTTRALADRNLTLLQAFIARHADLLDWTEPRAGMVGYVRYHGQEGVEAFVTRMAGAGILLLPASVFRSELVALPDDHFRIGFGRSDFPEGLAALEAALGITEVQGLGPWRGAGQRPVLPPFA